NLELELPFHMGVVSPLAMVNTGAGGMSKTVMLSGRGRTDTRLYLINQMLFEKFNTSSFDILSNLNSEGLTNPAVRNEFARRVTGYLEEMLGPYPFEVLMVTEEDYESNPLYGLNQLPEIVRPYPNEFTYDLKLFKMVSET